MQGIVRLSYDDQSLRGVLEIPERRQYISRYCLYEDNAIIECTFMLLTTLASERWFAIEEEIQDLTPGIRISLVLCQ